MICVSLEEEKYYFCTMISFGPSSLLFRHGENFNIAIVLNIINVDSKLCTRAILVHTTFSDCDHISRSLQHHLVMEIHGCIFWWVLILSSSDFLLLYAWTRSLLPTFAIIDALFFNKNCNIVLEGFFCLLFSFCVDFVSGRSFSHCMTVIASAPSYEFSCSWNIFTGVKEVKLHIDFKSRLYTICSIVACDC